MTSALAAEVDSFSADNLEAYIFMTCKVSAEDNCTLTSLVFYGQKDTSEALATYDLANGKITLTQGVGRIVAKLNELGLFPRPEIDYWQILNSMSKEPKAVERRSSIMTNEEAHKMARDEEVMRISQYEEFIARDKKDGIRRVIGTSKWPSEVVNLSEVKPRLGKRTYDCCDKEGCTRREDCNYMSVKGRSCICRDFRLASDCDWSTVIVYPNIGVQQFWHCNS